MAALGRRRVPLWLPWALVLWLLTLLALLDRSEETPPSPPASAEAAPD